MRSYLVGGKALNLGRLLSYDVKIPDGFCITTQAFHHFVESSGISTIMRDMISGVDFADPKSIEQKSKHLRNLLESRDLPEDLHEEISSARQILLERAKSKFVAVRSSFSIEDSIDKSFAGQFDTFLCVPIDDTVRYVKKCWGSVFAERAMYYSKDYLEMGNPAMAVIVQSMVMAEKAGVCFTAHPITKDKNVVVVEAVWGLGDLLVSGVVTPDHFEIDTQTKGIVERVGAKKYMSVLQSGKLKRLLVPSSKRDMRCLSESELDRIVNMSKRIEDYFKAPQDIEWAISGTDIFVLQARPISTIR